MPVRTPSTPDWFNIQMSGMATVSANLDKFAMAMPKHIRRALQATGQPIKEAAQAGITKVRTGALRDSVDIKIIVKADVARMYIGPRRGIKIPVKVIEHGTHKGQILVAIPTRYAHLVEFGHRVVVHGQEVGFVAPVPFMRNAWMLAGGQTALDNFTRALEESIAQDASL